MIFKIADHKHVSILNSRDGKTVAADEFLKIRFRGKKKPAKRSFPDLGPWDLGNPNDVCSVHALLVLSRTRTAIGILADCHDDLRFVAIAACMARRLATKDQKGYFRSIVQHGFSKFGPSDADRDAANVILKEIE